ncbi:uncharacterized protein O3Q21_004639 isoform 2-T3 [Podargus strigoides]
MGVLWDFASFLMASYGLSPRISGHNNFLTTTVTDIKVLLRLQILWDSAFCGVVKRQGKCPIGTQMGLVPHLWGRRKKSVLTSAEPWHGQRFIELWAETSRCCLHGSPHQGRFPSPCPGKRRDGGSRRGAGNGLQSILKGICLGLAEPRGGYTFGFKVIALSTEDVDTAGLCKTL